MIVFSELLIWHVSNPCFEAKLLDLAPSIDGVQAECSVVDELPDGTQRVIPACDGGTDRCWAIASDPLNCPPLGLRLDVTPFTEAFPPGLAIVAQCVSAER